MHPRIAWGWILLGGLVVPAFAWERMRGEPAGAPVTVESKPVLRVLSVGVGRYSDQPCLSYAVRDARTVARAFENQSATLFARVDARVLTDDQADRRGLLAAFQELRRSARPGDVTIIYYVGHAGNDAPIGFYLAPGRYCDRFWRQTMVKGIELRHAWEAIPGRVIVLLDTCYTGVLWDEDPSTGKHASAAHAEAVLGATQTSESTKGSRFWPGDFTQVLLESLAGAADADGDGRITLGELASHLERRVSARRDGDQNIISVVAPSLRDLALARP